MYFAVIGNIISAEKMVNKERYEMQNKVDEILTKINKEYKNDIAFDFRLTLGDEFQGLIKTASAVLEILDKIEYLADPLELRFGIGIGPIYSGINKKSSHRPDGPAFWNAGFAIQQMKKNKSYIRPKILFETEDNERNKDVWIEVINESLSLCDFIERGWTDKQKNIIRESIFRYGYDTKVPQKELAELFEISIPAVNVHMKRSGYYNFMNLRKAVSDALQKEWGEIDTD
ncbi:SatD family protein [Methanimicrococcus blatticola]|uniref:SatD family protein n=1 Tax=Methanimicrococcus blatticola TaxID=91560 RepID=A0A484F415_9EURY|nr:SatD family protein [Methanimicrococcus blatticola]MBZ3935933.1 SatD family protein [Methanimicrococcus blatticola]MCC2509454.1 SatD family protein [Methanimicrococcus blatticola]TDQ68333.1 SatD family protein [Methanimicrococcus blatticola]